MSPFLKTCSFFLLILVIAIFMFFICFKKKQNNEVINKSDSGNFESANDELDEQVSNSQIRSDSGNFEVPSSNLITKYNENEIQILDLDETIFELENSVEFYNMNGIIQLLYHSKYMHEILQQDALMLNPLKHIFSEITKFNNTYISFYFNDNYKRLHFNKIKKYSQKKDDDIEIANLIYFITDHLKKKEFYFYFYNIRRCCDCRKLMGKIKKLNDVLININYEYENDLNLNVDFDSTDDDYCTCFDKFNYKVNYCIDKLNEIAILKVYLNNLYLPKMESISDLKGKTLNLKGILLIKPFSVKTTTAIIKISDNWILFNDKTIEKVEDDEIYKIPAPYAILLYQ